MYEAQPGADDRIAGYDAQTVTLRPRDSARFMQRWWLERQTGLLLRADGFETPYYMKEID